jgi:geranylgeranyl diphosphate synthase type II
LCLAVAAACGKRESVPASAAATAIELLHCASLVHDDMPCFDNAGLRRGKPSVHVAFGTPIAVLTGDALIVLAFETVARDCAAEPALIGPICATVGRAVGMPNGIVAGQAWESEEDIPLAEYHRAKTAALFTGAAACGAISAGTDPHAWMAFGDALGAAYQIADDLRDLAGDEAEIGKPCGQDQRNERPNATSALGVDATLSALHDMVGRVVAAIPPCSGAEMLEQLIEAEAKRLVPVKLASSAA